MASEERVSTELKSVAELPPPLASAMRQRLFAHDTIKLLIYKPAEVAGMESSPPKALAIVQDGFVFVELPDGQPNHVVRAAFDSVLLVELATLLLYGHLRIDFADANRRSTLAMEYNSVSHELYRRAANIFVTRASPAPATPRPRERPVSLDMASWPTVSRRAAEFATLAETPVHCGAWWPSVRGGFSYELAPAGVILARDDRLTVVTLEQSGPWDRVRAVPTYGTIATYLPAGRIAKVEVHRTPKLVIIDLQMHALHGGEPFHLAIPVDRESDVMSVIKDVIPSLDK